MYVHIYPFLKGLSLDTTCIS